MTTAVVALAAALAALGAVLVASAVQGVALRRERDSAVSDAAVAHATPTWWWRLALGACVAGGVWAATGWPVAGLWFGALAAWVPSLVLTGRQRTREMEVAGGVARLASMMRDQVLVGADVAEAVQGCVSRAPAPIGAAVGEMARRLRFEDPTSVVADFATAVDDPMAEMLAVSVGFALTRRTARLAELFDEVARATEEQVSTRRAVEKDRRRLRTVTWSVMAAVTLWLVGIYVVSGVYLAPYDGLKGQAVMAVAGGAFAAGLAGLAKMDRIAGPKHLRLRRVEEAVR